MVIDNTLIAVLGWEDRFIKGLENDLNSNSINQLILIEYTESSHFAKENMKLLKEITKQKNVNLKIISISVYDPVKKWKIFEKFFLNNKNYGTNVLLDISTMPRDTIWSLLFFLRKMNLSIRYIYHKPQFYNPNWLSREPGKPRLLFKHSGITKFGLPTALIVITGFESERTRQLVNFFEPKLTVLAVQTGNQYDNQSRNNKEIHDAIKGFTEIKDITIDAYSEDNGLEIIKKTVEELEKDYNIILASLGPKITSIAIYKVFNLYPHIALSYVSSKKNKLRILIRNR